MLQKTFFLADETATLEFGKKFATICPSSAIIYLKGHLGAGKTTFVRGFLRQLGFTDTVKSPTYTLVESYKIAGKTIFHFDLYRIHDPAELIEIGFAEYCQSDAICLIEWPEQGASQLPAPDIILEFVVLENGREVKIETKKFALDFSMM